jgi:hypothetical protein
MGGACGTNGRRFFGVVYVGKLKGQRSSKKYRTGQEDNIKIDLIKTRLENLD